MQKSDSGTTGHITKNPPIKCTRDSGTSGDITKKAFIKVQETPGQLDTQEKNTPIINTSEKRFLHLRRIRHMLLAPTLL